MDGAALREELGAYLKRPENRAVLEEQQKEDFDRVLTLQERGRESAFVEMLSTLDASLEKKLRPALKHEVLRRLLIAMSGTTPEDFRSWISNPRVLEMLQEAHRLLRRGAISEEQMSRFLLQYVRSTQPTYNRPHCVSLATADLLAPLNEQLEERQQGNAEYRRGDLKAAQKHYDRALAILELIRGRHTIDQHEIDRCRNDVWLNLASVEMRRERYGAAIDLCSRVIDVDPGNIKALRRRAVAYRSRHEPDAARADLLAAMGHEQRIRFE